MYKIVFLLAGCLSLQLGWSQLVIKGTVVDGNLSQPLAGATIYVGGKALTQSDKSGKFILPCSGNTDLAIGYVGYETQKVS